MFRTHPSARKMMDGMEIRSSICGNILPRAVRTHAQFRDITVHQRNIQFATVMFPEQNFHAFCLISPGHKRKQGRERCHFRNHAPDIRETFEFSVLRAYMVQIESVIQTNGNRFSHFKFSIFIRDISCTEFLNGIVHIDSE